MSAPRRLLLLCAFGALGAPSRQFSTALALRGGFVAPPSPSRSTGLSCGGGRRRSTWKNQKSIARPTTPLYAFPRRRVGDDGHEKYEDEDDGDGDADEDDEPPSISMSPQEFLYRMKQSNGGDGDEGIDATIIPAANGRRRGRSPETRTAFGGGGSRNGKKGGKKKDVGTAYVCTSCGAEYVQWRGRCGSCLEWNTIQEYRVNQKSNSLGGGGFRSGGGGFSKSFQNKGSSWLDGVSSYDGCGGYDGRGGGPVRVTDVYRDILEDDGDGARSKGSPRERRTLVPDDPEMNAVLGGGIVPGSICLLGGDPGVGKSTLLLQMAGSVASTAVRSLQFQGIGMGPPKPSPSKSESEGEMDNPQKQKQQGQRPQNGGPVLYISGEENANQIASRALRLGIQDPELLLWCETDADVIADRVADSAYGAPSPFDGQIDDDASNGEAPPISKPPSLVIVDSIQTMLCDAAGSSAAGGVTQVRECVGLFLRLAKSTGVPIMLVGHVTKSGDVAGPRTVEHMVDCVLYLEGGGLGAAGGGADDGGGASSLRVLRAAKNRFGSSEEVGVYEAGPGGRLLPVSDPSSLFLSTRRDGADAEGCAISVALEGVRSMTVEVQALVAYSAGSGGYSGRRIVDGISNSRLLLILAVLQKRYGISFHRRDVYVNVVGGMHLGKGSKSGGGGSDLAVAIAAVSSLLGIPVRSDTAFVGEVGLLGELRPVPSLGKRVGEARRMGFSRIVTPSSSGKGRRAKRAAAGGGDVPGPRRVSAGGIEQLVCDNMLDAINCGLVDGLPTKQTRSGQKLVKPKRFRSNDHMNDAAARRYGMDELDIILDDEDDEIF